METSDWVQLFHGAWTTLWISGCAMMIGIPAGLVIALLREARIPGLGAALSCYVSIGRATSLVTLVLLIFFGAPSIGLDLSPWLAAIIALALNTTAFNAEIWRSALLSFPREQLEAAQAAGMTKGLMLRRIILPQIATTSLPALVNEMSLLLKSSPAVAVIGVVDLTRVTNRIAAVTYEPLPSILGACVLYMVMVGAMVWLQRFADQRARRLAM
ncbi:amino acid ABC transporter permease [Paraburkholderia tropica]|uniref:amino acid ABC transporter permease n=1 Tax=Paraburkholderia tropica TaxID=92647 RepID=UPI0007EDDA8B|nr:amino acid ABC transporter permease [Paraburkholderia tropica]OBR46283.1 ABC transporter permease [Paraburkholderia tropica]